jgi:hypothetical protein
MLERKRAARGYGAVPGEDELDVELGENAEGQESGVVRPTVEQELERWDENAEDWDTTEPEPVNGKVQQADDGDLGDGKKRNDWVCTSYDVNEDNEMAEWLGDMAYAP